MKAKIWPHRPGEGGIICMPLMRNVPDPQNDSWHPTNCPKCGADCWETDICREVVKAENLQALCTECALRAEEKSR